MLHGRHTTNQLEAHPNVTVLGSDAFWEKVSGISDFRERLLTASTLLKTLLEGRAAAEVARIAAEARRIFGDSEGRLRLDVLANPPRGKGARSAP